MRVGVNGDAPATHRTASEPPVPTLKKVKRGIAARACVSNLIAPEPDGGDIGSHTSPTLGPYRPKVNGL
jgi:hypothetical protein